jgi:hypothetical protein
MKYLFPLIFSVIACTSCSEFPKEKLPVQTNTGQQEDTLSLIRNFLPGLWSLDTGNSLTNDGYLILPDGSLNVVASEVSGTWELHVKDTLKFIFPGDFTKPYEETFKLDSLSVQRMVLHSENEKYIFRKIPYGKNPEGIVLSGYSGSIYPGTEKEYNFELPSAKEINITLNCENKSVVFRIYDNGVEITPADLKKWQGILVHGGKYMLKIKFPGRESETSQSADYNVKVIAY